MRYDSNVKRHQEFGLHERGLCWGRGSRRRVKFLGNGSRHHFLCTLGWWCDRHAVRQWWPLEKEKILTLIQESRHVGWGSAGVNVAFQSAPVPCTRKPGSLQQQYPFALQQQCLHRSFAEKIGIGCSPRSMFLFEELSLYVGVLSCRSFWTPANISTSISGICSSRTSWG